METRRFLMESEVLETPRTQVLLRELVTDQLISEMLSTRSWALLSSAVLASRRSVAWASSLRLSSSSAWPDSTWAWPPAICALPSAACAWPAATWALRAEFVASSWVWAAVMEPCSAATLVLRATTSSLRASAACWSWAACCCSCAWLAFTSARLR